ncbi:head completion/stabilization protein [Marinimicrobium sp. ARAG 43.8]|uniref:head completion/stabilization protein n=1 Tax=Marinimicrobium sp. ARAG 43.8 TaxID=3418719 RepID=UPI003CE7171A
MNLIAPNTPAVNEEADKTLANHSFFPEISVLAFRRAMRVDTVTTSERAEHALEAAMLEANNRLWNWVMACKANGVDSLKDVPSQRGQPEGAAERLYQRAVYCLAKANVVERYRDYDTTREGHGKATELEPVADDYRRDAAWAINDLMGESRTTVELI